MPKNLCKRSHNDKQQTTSSLLLDASLLSLFLIDSVKYVAHAPPKRSMNHSSVLRHVALFWCCCGFPVWAVQPIIDSFSPEVGAAGDKINVYGSGFNQANIHLYFWQNVTPAFVVISDTQIQATVPSGIGTGPLGVQLGTGSIGYTTDDFLPIGSGPYISSVSPTFGATNDTGIFISGVHLTNALSVTFGGVAAGPPSRSADGYSLTVTVPYGAKSGPVAVTSSGGGVSNGPNFLVIGPGPYITGFTPVTGGAGTVVNVSGRFFTGVTSVKFNGVPGSNLFVQGDSALQITAPANVATGPISALGTLGTNTTITNFFVPPAVTGMVPGTGRSGTNVILMGTSLSNTYSVTFNGMAAASFTVLSNTAIQATVPNGASDGLMRVIAPAGSAFSPSNFIVQPTVFGFSPNFGIPGVSSITITGANFNVGTPMVRFNGTQATSISGVSFGQLTATVPTGATTGPISVSTVDGSHTNSALFYVPATIVSFSPTNSPPGTTVILSGQNFLGASAVTFNGTSASFTPPTNNTTLICIVPTNFVTGPISVTVPAGTVSSSALFYAAPIITNFVPTHGLPGTNVAITGQSFLGTKRVLFNGTNSTIVSVSNTQIVATVPPGAQTGPITVEAPAGTNTTVANFLLDYTSDVTAYGSAAPEPVTQSSNLVYTIVFGNAGPWDAPNLRWTNLLSSSVDFVNASVTAGTWATNGSTIFGSLGTLANQSTITLTITVRPHSSGIIADYATVTSDNPDPNPANNTFTTVSTVQPLALLSIRLMTNQIRVSWPSALSNYVLESRYLLTPPDSWSSNAGTSTLAGSIRYVLEPVTNSAKYYRLRK
jgi:uncharacterized repeat protein (TIGR01451 family)